MKKIFAVSKVKNDSDIIESFCRYYAGFTDGMIICDDGSDDNTVQILKNLISEDINIVLVYRCDFPHFKTQQKDSFINVLVRKAFDEYNADAVLPLNVDEFLYSACGENPRNLLEELDEASYYKLRRRNAVYEKEPVDSGIFLPDYFTSYLDESYDRTGRTIMTRTISEKYGGRITLGCHGIEFVEQPGTEVLRAVEYTKLRYAHYAVRGPAQYTIKAVTGWMNFIKHNIPGAAYHWKKAYETVKENGILTHQQTYELSLYLYELYGSGDLIIHRNCKDLLRTGLSGSQIKLKYTDYDTLKTHFWKLVLSHMESTIIAMRDTEK